MDWHVPDTRAVGACAILARVTFAARITPRLLALIVDFDERSPSIAETCRRVGVEAERRGLTRPSYERVRRLVHATRWLRKRRGPSTGQVLLDVLVWRSRPPQAFLDHVAGLGLPPYDETAGFT